MSDTSDPNVHVRTEGARTEQQRSLMEADAKAGQCPFCTEREIDKAIDDLGTDHWWAKHCEPPYTGTEVHLLLITRAHYDTRQPNYLPAEVLADKTNIIEAAKAHFGLSSGVIMERFGDKALNAQTVFHPHIHLFVSNGKPITADMFPEGFIVWMRQLTGRASWPTHESLLIKLATIFPGQADDPMELLDKFREYLDAYRAMVLGKAWPIRPKLSNAVVPQD